MSNLTKMFEAQAHAIKLQQQAADIRSGKVVVDNPTAHIRHYEQLATCYLQTAKYLQNQMSAKEQKFADKAIVKPV